MIIGISGLIGSGKDTVANFLIEKGFVKGSFADSLKDSVSASLLNKGGPSDMC